MESTTENSTSSSPSATGPLRRFLMPDENRLVVLRNHVWTAKGRTCDAFEVVGTVKSVSHRQLELALHYGILVPADESTAQIYQLRPSQQAEALAHAA